MLFARPHHKKLSFETSPKRMAQRVQQCSSSSVSQAAPTAHGPATQPHKQNIQAHRDVNNAIGTGTAASKNMSCLTSPSNPARTKMRTSPRASALNTPDPEREFRQRRQDLHFSTSLGTRPSGSYKRVAQAWSKIALLLRLGTGHVFANSTRLSSRSVGGSKGSGTPAETPRRASKKAASKVMVLINNKSKKKEHLQTLSITYYKTKWLRATRSCGGVAVEGVGQPAALLQGRFDGNESN